MKITKNDGFTIVAAIIAFALAGATTVALISLFSSQARFTAKMDKKVQGDQVLVLSGNALQQADYDALIELCNQKSAFSGSTDGKCTLNHQTQLNPAAAPKGNPDLKTLEVLRTFEGNPSAQGDTCVELSQCKQLAGGRATDITLRGFWRNPGLGATAPLATKTLTFRRTRW